MNTEELIKNEKEIVSLLLSTKREGIQELIKFMKSRKYFESPASIKFHGNFKGGLMQHSLNVLSVFKFFNNNYNLNIPLNSIIIVSLCHDLCKAGLYSGDETIGYKINSFIGRKGHSKYSIQRLKRFIRLTELESDIIMYHMVYYKTTEFSIYGSEYSIKELCNAQNDKRVKFFYFADDIAAQALDKKK